MRIGLLNNLSAGQNHTQVGRLLNSLQGYKEVSHVETSAAGAVPEALAELARQDVELLVVNGGDGTLVSALSEILGEGAFEGRVPMLAVLRGGRTNMTALDLGTSRNSVRAMAGLMESVRRGSVCRDIVERSVLRVEYGPNGSLRYGMFFGAGVIHRGIDLVHRTFRKDRQGLLGASIVSAALLARMAILGDSKGVLTPDKIGILVDGTIRVAKACPSPHVGSVGEWGRAHPSSSRVGPPTGRLQPCGETAPRGPSASPTSHSDCDARPAAFLLAK